MQNDTKKYTVQRSHEDGYYIHGPSFGSEVRFSYYGGTLCPNSRFEDKEFAQLVADFCNAAFRAGQEDVRYKLRDLINGVEHT